MFVPLTWYLILSAALFGIGLFGVLARRNAIGILIGVELMLNSVNINMLAFWRFVRPDDPSGQVFAIFVLTVAAAEAAIGLALMIAIYRSRQSINVEELDALQG